MATDTNQYKNAPIYGEPKKLDEGKTFRKEAPIPQQHQTGETAKEIAPLNSGKD